MGGGRDLQNLSPTQNLMLGMVSGVCSKLTNYPLLSWKNSVQQGLGVSMNPAVVYRGLPMACLNLGGTTAVQFWFTGFFQRMLSGGEKLTPTGKIAGAFLGGVASGLPCSVWELTMIQQQRFGGTIWGTPARVVSEYGGAMISRGVTMTVGREALFTMAMLGLTPVIQSKLVASGTLDNQSALAVGALVGGVFSGVVSHPMDTIKTCMQGDLGKAKYGTFVQTGQSLAAEYGVAQGLFKGLAFRTGLIVTTFFLINNFKVMLCPVLFGETKEEESR